MKGGGGGGGGEGGGGSDMNNIDEGEGENFLVRIPIFSQIVHVGDWKLRHAINTNKCVPLRYVLVSRLLSFYGLKWLCCYMHALFFAI